MDNVIFFMRRPSSESNENADLHSTRYDKVAGEGVAYMTSKKMIAWVVVA